MQTDFTCFKAEVIRDYLRCIFLNDNSTAVCDRDEQTGSHKDDPLLRDHADLVGRVVSFAGRSSEKGVRANVGGFVRGIGLAALDNEVIAEVLAPSSRPWSRNSRSAPPTI